MWMMAMWQSGDVNDGNMHLLTIFVGVIAFGAAVQAIGLIVLALQAKKSQRRMIEISEEVKGRVMPVVASLELFINSTQAVIHDVSPKVKVITENMVDVSHTVRTQVHELDAKISEVTRKAEAQVNRADEALTSAINSTGQVIGKIEHGIMTPVKQVLGLINGVKASVEALTKPRSKPGSGPYDSTFY